MNKPPKPTADELQQLERHFNRYRNQYMFVRNLEREQGHIPFVSPADVSPVPSGAGLVLQLLGGLGLFLVFFVFAYAVLTLE